MRRVLTGLITTLFLLGAVGIANAITITDLYGDKDGFGLGITNGYTQPTWPAPNIVQDDAADTGTITDMKLWSDQTWSHTYDISEFTTIASASLEIMTYAQGYKGTTNLYLDDQLVGSLTDGDNTWEDSSPNENQAWIDIFDLLPSSYSLDGASTLRIDVTRSDDWWYLDYSELTITGEKGGRAAPVPEPSTMVLLGCGLMGLGGLGRKKFKK